MDSCDLRTNQSVADDVRMATAILAEFPGVTRAWFFGSAAMRQPLDFASDLDFAVEGLTTADFIPALGRLLNRLGRAVDLVRWETASDAMRVQIASTGTVIHAA